VESAEEALHRATARGSAFRARTLSRLVLDVAAAGDAVALAIAKGQSDALGDYAITAARRVKLDHGPFSLVLSGGVLRHSSGLITNGIIDRVRAALPLAQPVRAEFEPAVGALLLALEQAGVAIDDRVRANLRATMPAAALFATG
jgi:N-acetylglucosamine kinase-like BadF-type ATPase